MSSNPNTLDIEEAYQTMHIRLGEELRALGISHKEVIRLLGCGNSALYPWLRGTTRPSPYYLAKLYLLGCDVIYILTGIPTQGGDFDV